MNLDTNSGFELLCKSLQDLCDSFNRKEFQPLLEADAAAYLYHRLLENGCPLPNLYSETRLWGIFGEHRKFDIVIGTIDTSYACIQPILIVQIKCFQRWGLSPQQHRRRFEGIVQEDIESLKQAAGILENGRVELIFDFLSTTQSMGYLSGNWYKKNRRDVLIDLCKCNNISLIWDHPNSQNQMEVEQLV
jgi:hypothetical protein